MKEDCLIMRERICMEVFSLIYQTDARSLFEFHYVTQP